MRLFGRKKRDNEPVALNERSPRLGITYGDLLVLNQLVECGADVSRPREVIFYLHAGNEDAARAMAAETEAYGLKSRVREPSPEDGEGQDRMPWTTICETTAVVHPDFIRETRDFLEPLVARHQALYDGWEAAVSADERQQR